MYHPLPYKTDTFDDGKYWNILRVSVITDFRPWMTDSCMDHQIYCLLATYDCGVVFSIQASVDIELRKYSPVTFCTCILYFSQYPTLPGLPRQTTYVRHNETPFLIYPYCKRGTHDGKRQSLKRLDEPQMSHGFVVIDILGPLSKAASD